MNLGALIKPLFKIDKHMDLVPHTALILKNDGKEDIYNYLHEIDEAKWLTENGEPYRVIGGGYYHWETVFCNQENECHHVYSERPYDWIDHGSHLSINWFNTHFAGGGYNVDTFRRVAGLIIPHALRFSAGFLYKFFREAEI